MSRKPAAPAARQSIGIRTRTDLKQRLEQIATDNGRSLAQECEFRLERSLAAPESGLRQIIREEIRAALGSGKAVPAPSPFNGGMMLCDYRDPPLVGLPGPNLEG